MLLLTYVVVMVPYLATFDVDVNGMLALAESFFNMLWPVFQIVVAIGLGIGLCILVASQITKAIRGAGAR